MRGHSIFEVLQILRSLVSHNGISIFFFFPHNKEKVDGALNETKKRMWKVFLNIEMLNKNCKSLERHIHPSNAQPITVKLHGNRRGEVYLFCCSNERMNDALKKLPY